MSGDGHDEVHEAAPAGVGQWADRSDRYLVPVAGILAITLGISLATDLKVPWAPFTPLLLIALGGGMVANAAVGLFVRDSQLSAGVGAMTQASVQPAVLQASSKPGVFSRSPHSSSKTPHEPRQPKSATGAVSNADYRVAPGDFLWGSWVPPTRKLPGELVGPVPETAYVPPRQGSPTLHAEGEPIGTRSRREGRTPGRCLEHSSGGG